MLDNLIREQRSIEELLRSNGQLSLVMSAERIFKPAFVLACGSFCEQKLLEQLEAYVARHKNTRLTRFVRVRAIDRKYHDLFDWDANNSNKFWRFFGEDIPKEISKHLAETTELKEAERAFLNLGRLRNLVAHQFESASIEQTLDELATLKDRALRFLDFVNERLENM